MHYRTFVHTTRAFCWRALAILSPSLALVGCSSGSTARAAGGPPVPVAPMEGSASPARLPTWVASDGSYEIVARDVREIAEVQPLIEREYERFLAIHGVPPRRVQFVIDDDSSGRARSDAIAAPLANGMQRVTIHALHAAVPPAIGAWLTPRTRAAARP